MKRITFLMASILCLAACNNEVHMDRPVEGSQITLSIPDATVQTYSTATQNECYIESLWVLVFNGNTLIHDTMIDGSKITRNGESLQRLPQLPFQNAISDGNRIVFIANSDAVTYPHPNRASINYSNINTYFPLKHNDYYHGGEYLPMYGEIIWSSTNLPSCEMTRAVAKIQVQMGTNPSDITGNFTAENVTYKIYNCAGGGYIQPAAGTGIPLTAPVHTSRDFYLLQKTGATNQQTSVYLYEFKSGNTTGLGVNVADNVFHSDRQSIILKKTAGAVSTYYRLDFYDFAAKKFLDTKRNHHYLFTVRNIQSEGYADESDAWTSPGSNIEYEVKVNDVATSHVTSNGQYAVITSVDTAFVTVPSTGVTVAQARYQLGDGMASMTPGTNSVSLLATTVSPAGSLTLVSPTALTDSNVDVKVNVSTGFQMATIQMQIGNITHHLVVKAK